MHVCFCVSFVFYNIPTVCIICLFVASFPVFLSSSLPHTSYQCLLWFSMGSVTPLFYCLAILFIPCFFSLFFIDSGVVFVNTPQNIFCNKLKFPKEFQRHQRWQYHCQVFCHWNIYDSSCQSTTWRWQQPFSFTTHKAMKVSMLIKEHSWIYNDSNGDDS